jgi:serine/threonine-protein kinase RsbW
LASGSQILLTREFNTSRDEIVALPRLLEEARTRCTISDDQFFNLVVAMTEAVNNAIVHGNRLDPDKRVRYSLECRDEGVHCVVEDEGEGFDPGNLDDPVSPENLLREGGRGMFLIRALMKNLHVENTGRGSRVEFLCGRE